MSHHVTVYERCCMRASTDLCGRDFRQWHHRHAGSTSSARSVGSWASRMAHLGYRMHPVAYAAADVADGATTSAQQGSGFPPAFKLVRCRALVLDSSYRPIDVVNWQRAICLDLFDKVRTLCRS